MKALSRNLAKSIRRSFDYSSRSTPREFWCFVIVQQLLLSLACLPLFSYLPELGSLYLESLSMVEYGAGAEEILSHFTEEALEYCREQPEFYLCIAISVALYLVTLPSLLSLTVRRLTDTGMTRGKAIAWAYAAWFLPLFFPPALLLTLYGLFLCGRPSQLPPVPSRAEKA